jgi:hypothetical protein
MRVWGLREGRREEGLTGEAAFVLPARWRSFRWIHPSFLWLGGAVVLACDWNREDGLGLSARR